MRFGSLFTGIGGIDLGLERAGWECAWQVEIDPFCQRVLERHWAGLERVHDVTTWEPEARHHVDLIAGGFPCQDVSQAGLRAGLEGERSGLWREFARVVRLLRPRFVLVENVAGLLTRGLGDVLGDLAELGFDAEWRVLRASDFGAPHLRARVFIVAASRPVPNAFEDCLRFERERLGQQHGDPRVETTFGRSEDVADATAKRLDRRPYEKPTRQPRSEAECAEPDAEGRSGALADAGRLGQAVVGTAHHDDGGHELGHVADGRHAFPPSPDDIEGWERWLEAGGPQPGVGAHGLPNRVDRVGALGNAVVPQVAEWIGRRLMRSARAEAA